MVYNPATPTADIAHWVVNHARDTGFTARAFQMAELSVIDTIACMFAGLVEPGPATLKSVVRTGPELSASVIGLGTGAGAYDAALINGTSAHMLDFDDGDMVSRGHPSCVILPTVMVMAEERRLSGRDLLDAFIVGWSVMQTIGGMVNPYMPRRGYHVTSVVGVVAAAAAAARLLRLNEAQTAVAMGIAASAGAGIRGNFGTDMKPYHAGCAAAAAVRATELAEAGFTASSAILETHDGFVAVLADKAAVPEVRKQVDRLISGDINLEKEPPIIKFLPICHATHSSVEAALKLRSKLPGGIGSIKSIVAEAGSHTAQYLIHSKPKTGLEAKFSMEGAIAIALIDGEAGPNRFTDESVMRPEVQELLRKVTYRTHERYDDARFSRMQPGAVTITTQAGTMQEEVLDPIGGRVYPATIDQVCGKLHDGAAGILDSSAIAAAIRSLKELRTLGDVSLLGHILRGSPRESSIASVHGYEMPTPVNA